MSGGDAAAEIAFVVACAMLCAYAMMSERRKRRVREWIAATGSCLAMVAVITMILGAAVGLIFIVVRIVRLAWSGT